MGNSRAGQGKYKISLEHFVPERRRYSMIGTYQKYIKLLVKSGTIRTSKYMTILDYNPLNKIGIHKSILNK